MRTKTPVVFESKNKLFAEAVSRIRSVLCCNNDSVRYYSPDIFGKYNHLSSARSDHWIWEFNRETFCDLADMFAA